MATLEIESRDRPGIRDSTVLRNLFSPNHESSQLIRMPQKDQYCKYRTLVEMAAYSGVVFSINLQLARCCNHTSTHGSEFIQQIAKGRQRISEDMALLNVEVVGRPNIEHFPQNYCVH